jgi:very-short-patch-repair endonuclease
MPGDKLESVPTSLHSSEMRPKQIARNLRRNQTDEEKVLWRSLRGRRFAGFKFRRQYTFGEYISDFYCADAKLAIELDGFQHGTPDVAQHDEAREKFLVAQGIETLRFWNHHWRKNRDGCLLEIWNSIQRRTGCVQIQSNVENQRFAPPALNKIKNHPSS